MKQLTLKFLYIPLLLTSCFIFMPPLLWCQDITNTLKGPPDEEDKWYSQPWIWIVGAALLTLLLLALLRRTKPTRSIADEDRISKTIGTESDDEKA